MEHLSSDSVLVSHDAEAHSPAPKSVAEQALPFVGQRLESMRGLSDEERELHIQSCTVLMELAYDRYCETSDLGDRGESDRWRVMRDEAIRGRSAAQIARMEAERGIA